MSESRLPSASDFPSSLTLSIIPPPQSQAPLNVLLLLHGLGDTHAGFTSLGKNLNLPYTACISLRAPSPLPALFTGSDAPSFHWGDDMLFDQMTGALDIDGGFTKSKDIIADRIIKDVLIQKCGFKPRDILILGFGQGAMPALKLAAEDASTEYGGIISIGGRIPSSISSASSSSVKAKTPVLLLGGSRSTQITKSSVTDIKNRFGDVEYVKWSKNEDSMPKNREEMLPIMRFFARRLRSRQGVPDGAVELGR